VFGIVPSPDGALLGVYWDCDWPEEERTAQGVAIWDLDRNEIVPPAETGSNLNAESYYWTPDGKFIASAPGETVWIADPDTGTITTGPKPACRPPGPAPTTSSRIRADGTGLCGTDDPANPFELCDIPDMVPFGCP
jgi:hypothetical protein